MIKDVTKICTYFFINNLNEENFTFPFSFTQTRTTLLCSPFTYFFFTRQLSSLFLNSNLTYTFLEKRVFFRPLFVPRNELISSKKISTFYLWSFKYRSNFFTISIFLSLFQVINENKTTNRLYFLCA